LKRNVVAGEYVPAKAQHKATVRRKAAKFQGMSIVRERKLQHFIEAELLKQQFPQAIAGRLATGAEGLPYISTNSIYRYIDSAHGRKLEYELKVLKQKRKGRRKRPPVETLGSRSFIDDRPSVITNRERVGDLEADFIVSGRTGTGYLLTAVDRKIRYGFIRKILPVTIVNVEAAFLDIKRQFPELTSVTLDNDILFRFHERLQQLLGVPVYFTHPYSSWQKGSIENLNGQIRKYVKKGADISQYDEKYLKFTIGRLNSRFMSVLDYKTPQECLDKYRQDLKNKKPH
jgi:IS30 family transposase